MRWGELLEERWCLTWVSDFSLLLHQPSLFFMEQKRVGQGMWESRSSIFVHSTGREAAVRSQPCAECLAPPRETMFGWSLGQLQAEVAASSAKPGPWFRRC